MGLAGALFGGYFLGSGPKKSMTYGTIPAETVFEKHFEAHVPRGRYDARMGRQDSEALHRAGARDPDGATCHQLYKIIEQLTAAWEDGDEDAGDLASAIMTTRGFEWI